MNILERKATSNPQVFISLDLSLILQIKKTTSKAVAANLNSPTIVTASKEGLAT